VAEEEVIGVLLLVGLLMWRAIYEWPVIGAALLAFYAATFLFWRVVDAVRRIAAIDRRERDFPRARKVKR
jgi:hypothetical protein